MGGAKEDSVSGRGKWVGLRRTQQVGGTKEDPVSGRGKWVGLRRAW